MSSVYITIRIFYPTCIVNSVKTHENLVQVIERNCKSRLIKIGKTDIVDTANLMELQHELII